MNLKGSGSENNPFLVSTWDEFKEALEYENNENFNENNLKYVSLNNDIDITKEKKGWMGKEEQIIITNYIKIIGNNYTIRSLPILDTFLFYKESGADYIYFENLKIENFYILVRKLSPAGLFSFCTTNKLDSIQGIQFYNCSFSGVLDGLHEYAGFTSSTYNKTTFNNCSFNLFLKDKATFYGALNRSAQSISMNNCNIYLQGKPYVDANGIFSTSGDLVTSQIRGHIQSKGRIGSYSSNFFIYLNGRYGAYNVIDLAIETEGEAKIDIKDSSTIVNSHNATNITLTSTPSDYLFDFADPAGDGSMTLEDKLIELNFLYGAE